MKLTPKHVTANEYYVYFLIDPRDGGIFYIGKGKGDRINAHVKKARKGNIDNVKKYQRIKEIHKEGLEVVTEKVHEYLSEQEAYKIERDLIRQHKQAGITNIAGGIVTNQELVRQQAIDMLDKLRPFSEWEKLLDELKDKDIFNFALNKYGSLYACWTAFRDDLIFLVNSNANSQAR